MHKYEYAVLRALSENAQAGLDALVSASGIGKDAVMWALENLKGKEMVTIEYGERERILLSDEARDYVKDGLPEEQLLEELRKKDSLSMEDLKDEKHKIGILWAKSGGLVEIADGKLRLTDAGRRAAKGVEGGNLLRTLAGDNYDLEKVRKNAELLSGLAKRKLIRIEKERVILKVAITDDGVSALKEGVEKGVDLVDRSMIAGETWKGKEFKKYDVNVGIESRMPAMRHPLKRMIEEIREAYACTGFREVSGPAVESSFWVFDSLFVPQDHPARDAQDTFYVSNLDNQALDSVPIKTIRKAHKVGWHTKLKEDVAGQMLLRTHTTSVSARYLYDIVSALKKDPNSYTMPIKLFSIGRVFRNETIDYKHLADFYQVDGLVIGKGLTLSNLFDELTKIYNLLGIKIMFKPSYFPFVEPGVEFMAYSEKTKEWIELGGAGLVREEITGVKRSKLTALAWGPGVDRALLIRDQSISSISELYNGNLEWIRSRKMI